MINKIKTQLQQPLPGRGAQQLMAHDPIEADPIHYWPPLENHRLAAVLLMLYPSRVDGDGLNLALIRRTSIVGDKHSGEMALPGGRHEPGEEFCDTALREAEEETGVDRASLSLLGPLTPAYIRVSNYLIYPFVAATPVAPQFDRCQREVAEIVEAPLSAFGVEHRREEIRNVAPHGPCRIPYFDIEGHKVWGATAMMLNEFSAVLERVTETATS